MRFIPEQVVLLERNIDDAGMQKTEVVFIYTHGQN